jgi:hypothetical protein
MPLYAEIAHLKGTIAKPRRERDQLTAQRHTLEIPVADF